MTKLVAALTAALLGTLPSTTPRIDHNTPNGAIVDFSFGFRTPSTSAIKVFVDADGVAGTASSFVLQEGGYAVALTPKGPNDTMYPGGTVTFTVAPVNGASVRIERTVPVTQDSLWTPYSAFKAKTLEGQLDYRGMVDQQLDRRVGDAEAALVLKRSTSDQTVRDAGQDDQINASRGTNGYTSVEDTSTVLATGGTVARPLKDWFAQTVSAKAHGAVCDWNGTTGADDTDALQAWINEAASRGAVAELPAPAFGKGCRYTKLTIPQGAGKSFTIRGAGAADDVSSVDPALYQRSILVSTDPTGPAIEIAGGAGYTARQIAIEGVTLLASNSTSVVKLTGANTGTRLKNVLLRQSGTGHGIDWLDVWYGELEDVIVQADRATTAAGSVGIRVRNTLDGGIFNATRVSTMRKYAGAGGFDLGMQFGALVGETQVANVSAIACVSCNTQSSNRGFVFGNGVKGATLLGAHTEFNATSGVHITNNATAVNIIGGFFLERTATAGNIVIDGDATSASQHSINITGNWFQVLNYGVDFANAGYTSGTLTGNWFERYGAGAGMGVRTRSNNTPWSLIGNTFSGMAATVDDTTVLAAMLDSAGGLAVKSAIYSPNGALTVKGATIGTDGVNVASGKVTLLADGTIGLNGAKLIVDSGPPEGAVTAPIGSLYLNKLGGAGTTLYAKESGAGSTGWVAR
jgi:hypothetical protein